MKNEIYIDNVDVSKCNHFLEDDNIPVIGHLKNFCLYHHDRCELFNCEFKRVSKNDTIKKYKQALEQIADYCNKCKDCVETGDEVILYTIKKKVKGVLNEN